MADDPASSDPKTAPQVTPEAAESQPLPPQQSSSPEGSPVTGESPLDSRTVAELKGRRPDGKFKKGNPGNPASLIPGRKGKSNDPEKASRHGRSMTHVMYESLWEAWRDGNRSKSALAKMFGVSWETVHRVVEQGSPQNNWPSLRERTKLWEAQQFHAQQKAAADRAITQSDEYQKARAENLKITEMGKAGIAVMMRKLALATQSATFVRQRKTTDKQGNTIMVDVPPDAHELAHTAAKLVQGLVELGKHESFWLGGPTERQEVTGALAGVLALKPEDVDHIIASGGDLPAGVTDEQIFGKAASGAGGN